MSKEVFLYLTTIGRKSSKEHRIEIWFVEHQQLWYMIAGNHEQAHWVMNLQQQPNVTFSLGHTDEPTAVHPITSAHARTVADDEALAATVKTLFDAKYKWSAGLVVELTPFND
jgi:hypothetical protein